MQVSDDNWYNNDFRLFDPDSLFPGKIPFGRCLIIEILDTVQKHAVSAKIAVLPFLNCPPKLLLATASESIKEPDAAYNIETSLEFLSILFYLGVPSAKLPNKI